MSAQTMPKLYQYNVCPFCWKAKAILGYKKIPYEPVEVHPLNKKEIRFSKNYKKVPIFVDEKGEQINDSTPIMRFIDQKFSDRPVFEKNDSAKKIEEQWLSWGDKVLVRALPPLIYQNIKDSLTAFDYITSVEKFGWFQQQYIKYSGAIVMTIVAKKSAKSQGITNPIQHLQKCLKDWEEAVGDKKFLGGDKPNAADLSIFGILKSIEELPAFILIKKQAKVYNWYQRTNNIALM